jgi:hypothetical protein
MNEQRRKSVTGKGNVYIALRKKEPFIVKFLEISAAQTESV